MNNVIEFPKKRAMVPGWDLECVVFRAGDEKCVAALQDALDRGCEPFAVTTFQEMTFDKLSKQPNGMIVSEKVWFKRPCAPVPEEIPEPPRLA